MKRVIKATNCDKNNRIWDKACAPHGNYVDVAFDKLQFDFGLNLSDFRASNMQRILKVADKLNVNYEMIDDNSIIIYYEPVLELEQELNDVNNLFIEFIRVKRCCRWEARDWDCDNNTLIVHFNK